MNALKIPLLVIAVLLAAITAYLVNLLERDVSDLRSELNASRSMSNKWHDEALMEISTRDRKIADLEARLASSSSGIPPVIPSNPRPRPQVWSVAPAPRSRPVDVQPIQRRDEEQSAKTAIAVDAMKKKAQAYADHYYRYEFLAGINNAVVTRLDIALEEPTAVSGWANRYAIEGDCSLEYYESATGTLNKKVAAPFTITLEWTGNQAKIVDFSKHYAPR